MRCCTTVNTRMWLCRAVLAGLSVEQFIETTIFDFAATELLLVLTADTEVVNFANAETVDGISALPADYAADPIVAAISGYTIDGVETLRNVPVAEVASIEASAGPEFTTELVSLRPTITVPRCLYYAV